MSITVGEKPGGVTYENGRLAVEYVAHGSTDEAAIRAAVEAYAPETRNGLGRQAPKCSEMEAAGYWDVSVEYISAELEATAFDETPSTGDKSLTIDLTVGGVEISRSLSTVAKYTYAAGDPPADPAPDFYGFLNVTDDGEGNRPGSVTLPGEGARITAVEYKSPAAVTNAYIRGCLGLRMKTNSAAFSFAPTGGPTVSFEIGELLYLGPVFNKRGSADWEASHQFLFQINATDIVIGKAPYKITVAAKKGWEYLWVYYRQTVGTTMAYPTPRYAYVEKVFDSGSFAGL